jgi:hypothetical protein
MKPKLTFILFLFYPLLVAAQTITVKQDGSGDFSTIQAAVDSAQNGDTVLVWPGVYVENISIYEKRIILGSLTLTTGDTNYINQTIIDGNKNGSCIRIQYKNENIINGFELKNGNGVEGFWGDGGGIFLYKSNTSIYNCYIHNNNVKASGGGISFYRSGGYLSNVTITNNHAYDRGGGIYLAITNGTLIFDSIHRCNIYENYAAEGVDIYKAGGPPVDIYLDTFTVQNPDYYYIWSAIDQVPLNDITIDIQHHKIEQTFADLYVAPRGDNQNSGLTPEQPLKTISFALLKAASDSVSPDTIHLASGTYGLSGGEHFPLSLKRDVSIKGTSRDSVILDAENEIFLLRGIYQATDYTISNITIQNGNGEINSPFHLGGFKFYRNYRTSFTNSIVKNCLGTAAGAGRIFTSNGFTLKNIIFKENMGGHALRILNASGTEVVYDTVFIINSIFEKNKPDYTIGGGFGGGTHVMASKMYMKGLITACFYNCLFDQNHSKNEPQTATYGATSLSNGTAGTVYLVNCTFADNTSDNPYGGNVGVIVNSDLYAYNSVFYNNQPREFYIATDNNGNSSINLYASLVDGGEENIDILSDSCYIYYDTSNIDTDPLFYGGEEFPYNLSDESPCIDAGTLDLPQFILDNMPDVDLAGNPRIFNGKIDMGAYEWNPTVGTEEHPTLNAKHPTPNLQVYPNPFSIQTTISAQWDKSARVNIEVYNNAGLLVKTLQSGKQLPGSCQIPWDGTDNNNNILPAGVYYIVLRIENKETESVKVVKQ